MNTENQRPRIEDDDSLLASVAGVPLTRSARIGAVLVWAAFWATRTLLTDAIPHLNQGAWQPALLELLGENPFDQGFSICMAWLTIEVAIITGNAIKTGVFMLIAKSAKPAAEIVAENLSIERLEAILEKKRRQQQARSNGASPPDNDAKPKT